MATAQRLASTVITGALNTTETNTLDAHANLLPVNLLLNKLCHRVAIWLASITESHLLNSIV